MDEKFCNQQGRSFWLTLKSRITPSLLASDRKVIKTTEDHMFEVGISGSFSV